MSPEPAGSVPGRPRGASTYFPLLPGVRSTLPLPVHMGLMSGTAAGLLLLGPARLGVVACQWLLVIVVAGGAVAVGGLGVEHVRFLCGGPRPPAGARAVLAPAPRRSRVGVARRARLWADDDRVGVITWLHDELTWDRHGDAGELRLRVVVLDGRPVRLDLVGAPAPALASLTWSTWFPDDDVAALQAFAGRAAIEVERVPWSKRASESWPPADASASYGSAAASLGALPVLAHAFVVSVVAGMCFSDAQPTSAAGVAGKVAGGAGLAAGLLLVLLAVMAGWVDQRPSGARRERRERSSPDRRRPAPSRHTEGHAP